MSLNKKMTYFPYFWKRKAFEYEQEVRVIIDTEQFIMDYVRSNPAETIVENEFPDICETGMSFNVDVTKLINEVIISPRAEEWIIDTIKSVIQQYGLEFPVYKSTLLDSPN